MKRLKQLLLNKLQTIFYEKTLTQRKNDLIYKYGKMSVDIAELAYTKYISPMTTSAWFSNEFEACCYVAQIRHINETNNDTLNNINIFLPIKLKRIKKLKRGDVFLWKSMMSGKYEIHAFHSDIGYGIKTFTNYNERNGSSILVNWSGVCGILVGNDH